MYSTTLSNVTNSESSLFSKTATEPSRYSNETGSEQKHARRFGNLSAAKPDLSDVLKDRAVDSRQADRSNQLAINRRHCEEVLTVGIDGEIILEETAIDVDAFDVNQH